MRNKPIYSEYPTDESLDDSPLEVEGEEDEEPEEEDLPAPHYQNYPEGGFK